MEAGAPATIPPPRVLLVLSETSEARRIAERLEEEGMEALRVSDEPAGYNILDTEQIDALLCETRAPRIDGLRLLRIARMRNPEVVAILVATPSEVPLATHALDEGAHDFPTRPLNVEKILAVLRRGLSVQRLVGEMHELARRLDRRYGFQNLIGSSTPIVRVYSRILQVSGMDEPVLIVGEPGTGRDLVAQAIHQNSARRSGPLVRIDCGGIAADALERELFGVEGDPSRPGRCERAASGTLVLDRIDELPAETQGKALRLVASRAFERVGGRRTRKLDARILAIGSHLTRQKAESGELRGDLFDALRSITIELPALRQRRRDIPLLVEHFLGEIAGQSGRSIQGIQPAALDRLVRYAWPGNVRELKSVLRGMVLAGSGSGPVDVADLPEEIRSGPAGEAEEIRIPIGSTIAEAERKLIESTLAHTRGDRARAARILGIGLRTLQRRLSEYGPIRKQPRSRRR
ncbi:MAG: sigma-54 dependent transcriptional regulator [Candidatus Eisenbacteria bacterium]|nr:sigma-54 dependent transcriptional regulator [Candidatus Eisenbacteria bacterium]